MTARRVFTLAMVVTLAGLAWWNWVVVLFSAPWLGALVWVIARCGADTVVPPSDEAFPSAAELARRRWAIR
jgi:hypothetical protein